MSKCRIAIFASGRGSNAIRIHQHCQKDQLYEVGLIVSNRKKAGVLEYAEEENIDRLTITRNSFYEDTCILNELIDRSIDMIILAGFLWLIPEYLITSFNQRIINIHPALLPKYGGKGMYGRHIHNAVYEACEKESGITIHWVNSQYDEGGIIFQTKVGIDSLSPEEIGTKVLKLEHHFYPRVIAALCKRMTQAG